MKMCKKITKSNNTAMAQTTIVQNKDASQAIINDAAEVLLEVLDIAIAVRDKSDTDYNMIDAMVEKLDKKIVCLLGRGETVIRKVRKGIALSPIDVDYITMNLKIIPHTVEKLLFP